MYYVKDCNILELNIIFNTNIVKYEFIIQYKYLLNQIYYYQSNND